MGTVTARHGALHLRRAPGRRPAGRLVASRPSTVGSARPVRTSGALS